MKQTPQKIDETCQEKNVVHAYSLAFACLQLPCPSYLFPYYESCNIILFMLIALNSVTFAMSAIPFLPVIPFPLPPNSLTARVNTQLGNTCSSTKLLIKEIISVHFMKHFHFHRNSS